jgi:hypothetical protein
MIDVWLELHDIDPFRQQIIGYGRVVAARLQRSTFDTNRQRCMNSLKLTSK